MGPRDGPRDDQEPKTRSVQLTKIHATAFLQVTLFLDKLFPAKNDCCRLDLFTIGCFEDDFDFLLRELCVVADEVDVPGSSTFCRSSSELLVSL